MQSHSEYFPHPTDNWNAAGTAGDNQVNEQVLVTLGDISATASTLRTPSGHQPLRGMEFHLTDMSIRTRKTPTWAIILAVIGFFFFLLGLLFLFVKEEKITGSIRVTARRGGFMHVTTLPVHNAQTIADIHGRVDYLQQLAR